MIYRSIGNTGLESSIIGLGGEWLNGKNEQETKDIIDTAMDNGINFLDVFLPQPDARSNIGAALAGKREKMLIQGHLCAVYENGQYERSRDINKVKIAFEDLLTRLQTDYIDVGMVHYVDSAEDYAAVFESEIIEYVLELKRCGIIRHIGLSSHNPAIALKAVESGLIEVLMFSINPAYDMEQSDAELETLMDFKGIDEKGLIIDPARQQLYAACANRGVGITVMKSLGAGRLLDAHLSPFGKPLTVTQCIHYCLTRPGVVSVLVGYRTPEEVLHALKYLTASEEEKKYSHIFDGSGLIQISGRCMYCNHCLPCPAHIDIAAVTKFKDLALMSETVPETVRAHYLALEKNANDCILCGKCEPNCPFGVAIRENMKKAKALFA